MPLSLRIQFFLLVVLTRCAPDEEEKYPHPPAGAVAGSFVVETTKMQIGDDVYPADYGSITVPENRSRLDSRLITIPFLRIRSLASTPAEPVFGLSGGPGNSNMGWNTELMKTFLAERDFVMVGYRGVDGSVILNCPEINEAFQEGDDPFSEKSVRLLGSAWTACHDRLKDEGVDLEGYTMLETIADNESVRMALGYERINLLSRSYGTRVAYLYGLRNPDRIFRSAMIGVNPPGHFVWEPDVTDAQLKYYDSLWTADPAMTKRCPDLYATLQKIPDKWLFFPINPDKVRVSAFFLLYHRNTAALVFDAYVAADQGDASGIALMSLAYDFMMSDLTTWGDLASKGVSADYDSTRNYLEGMDPPGMPLGAPGTKLLWGPLSQGRWQVRPIGEEFRKLQPSNVETLLLSGSVDFSTPAQTATNELLPMLTNGKQIILREYGHTEDVLTVNPENTRLLLTSFYRTGVPDTSLNAYVPMDFHTEWSLPLIAKSLLATVILLLAGIILITRAVIKRLGRSRMDQPDKQQ